MAHNHTTEPRDTFSCLTATLTVNVKGVSLLSGRESKPVKPLDRLAQVLRGESVQPVDVQREKFEVF